MSQKEKDAEVFGENAWVYCQSHMRPHGTGWCSVPPSSKIKLDATEREAAYAECRAKGFDLYGETKNSQ
jgi:hypothetical protein